MKTCNRCGQVKDLSAFYKRAAARDGHQGCCKECARDYFTSWYAKNGDAVRERSLARAQADPERNRVKARQWNADNPDRHRLRAKKHKHSRRALEKATSVGDVDLRALWNGLCALCEGAMDWDVQYPDPLSKSVDHIVPIKRGGGHVQSNVQWAHLKCNLSKGAKL